MTIVIARFLPFLRTFAPFVAGVAQMNPTKFVTYNIVGGVLWVMSLTTLGYLIGEMPWVKANFSLVTLAMIIIPGLPAVWVGGKTIFEKVKNQKLKDGPHGE
jgi:membrane-associated protein